MIRKYIFVFLIIVVFFVLGVAVGSVDIPLKVIWQMVTGQVVVSEAWHFIIFESRLPQCITAILAGGALAVSGLLLQTTFHNPLAAPDIFGVTSGASLAVALISLAPGILVAVQIYNISLIIAAFIGALSITFLIWGISRSVKNEIYLIIIGIMLSYLISSATTLLNFFASEHDVKAFSVWGMGNLGNVSLQQLPLFAGSIIVTLLITLCYAKPLNALMLGDTYAMNIGINIHHVRNILLLITGTLIAIVTAYCGPISFIALSVPHIARLFLKTSDHLHLLPMTILCGSAIMLLCNFLTIIPNSLGILPLNAITPLIGAPVIIYVILKRQK